MWWVILTFCVAVITILIFLLRKLMKNYIDMCDIVDELNFIEGNNDILIQKEEIIRKYENVILLYNIQRGTFEYMTVVDTSKYEKNNLIGLTYIVPAQEFDKLASDVKKNVKRKIQNRIEIESEWLDDSLEEIMQGTLIPMCDVYQLKNGKWIWRSKLEERGTF